LAAAKAKEPAIRLSPASREQSRFSLYSLRIAFLELVARFSVTGPDGYLLPFKGNRHWKRPDRFADRGLGGEYHLGGLGKATLAHDFDECAKGSKIQRILYQNIIQSINSFLSCPAAA
jgi:hypothetical protein